MAADTLTDAQARALRLADDGSVVAVFGRRGIGWALTRNGVTGSTLRALARRGLVHTRAVRASSVLTAWDARAGVVRLTPAGREALARHDREARA